MNAHISEDSERFIRSQVQSGRYTSESRRAHRAQKRGRS